uniref:Sperm flagellar 1 n=1 Tax=Anas platyrhynchos platyrhynchos TaxID=8840 RepID=A0A493TGR2_ANAPP
PAVGPGCGCGARLWLWGQARACCRARPWLWVLAAEVVKFFFPAMVQLHSFVPASSTPQKLANWGHLNRKVLRKLNLSLPDEVIRQVAQCRPGTAEQVLLVLRQKIEEKQKKSKALPGPHQVSGAWEVLGTAGGLSGCAGGLSHCPGCPPPCPRGSRSPAPPGDAAAARLQLAEKEQALLLAQETVQVSPAQLLQLKVRRLEQLLRLKDTRIDDLSRRLQREQR